MTLHMAQEFVEPRVRDQRRFGADDGFGRVAAAPKHGLAAFAAQTFGVTPDLMCVAKGLTNGAVPMGAVMGTTAIVSILSLWFIVRPRTVPALGH